MATNEEELENRRFHQLQQLVLFATQHQLVLTGALKTIIEEAVVPRICHGVRSVYTDPVKGSRWTRELLVPVAKDRLRRMTRFTQEAFDEFADMLRRQGVRDAARGSMTVEEKALIFLYICSQGVGYRNAAEAVHHSLRTISLAFHEVLDAISSKRILDEYIKLPPTDHAETAFGDDSKYWPYFDGCIGAIDGTHVPISVPPRLQTVWRNRKGQVTQNVLATCDFDLNITFVCAGMEGSAHDSRVFALAQERCNFSAPEGCYFLADAGYPAKSSLTLVPYSGVRYHLKEFSKTNKPTTAEELFNLRHASKRSAIERTFGVFKRRFQIFDRPRDGYSIRTQIRIFFALAAVHNFLNRYINVYTEAQEATAPTQIANSYGRQHTRTDDQPAMLRKRDEIAQAMWQDYQMVLAERSLH